MRLAQPGYAIIMGTRLIKLSYLGGNKCEIRPFWGLAHKLQDKNMAHVTHARPGIGIDFDGLGKMLKSFGKTFFSKLVASRMESARYRLNGFRP